MSKEELEKRVLELEEELESLIEVLSDHYEQGCVESINELLQKRK